MSLPPRLDAAPIVEALSSAGVDFIIVGGIAGTLHGSSYPTYDLDIAYSREPANLKRLVEALAPMKPALANAPADLPFALDEATLSNGANFTFVTAHGRFDILAHIPGVSGYEELRAHSIPSKLTGVEVRIASIDHLIAMKRAANRPKDKLMVEEYLVLADEGDRRSRGGG